MAGPVLTPEAGAAASCPRCGGSGWVRAGDGPVAPVARCDCYLEAELRTRLEAAAIPPRYQHSTLENFVTRGKGMHPSLDGAKLTCERYVEEFPRLRYGLLFVGPAGVGKTHLAVAVLRGVVERHGVVGRFANYRDLLRSIQDSYNPIAQSSELEILRPVLDADVLLLDELGTRRPTAWVLDTVTYILNDRYSHQRATLITTNYPDAPTDWSDTTLEDRVGSYARSRLYEMCKMVEMEGEDFRKQIRQAAWQ